MRYDIYSDGSDFKKTTHRLGIGSVLVLDDGSVYGKKIDETSQEISLGYINTIYGANDCSNPTMELLGVLFALQAYKKYFNKGDKIRVATDYIGTSEWLNGNWKINKHYIQKICSEIKELVRKESLSVEFRWIRGHQVIHDKDSYWNDYTDTLAKGLGTSYETI